MMQNYFVIFNYFRQIDPNFVKLLPEAKVTRTFWQMNWNILPNLARPAYVTKNTELLLQFNLFSRKKNFCIVEIFMVQ
jgi:hypothetical protein